MPSGVLSSVKIVGILVLVVGIISFALIYFYPAPPSRITIATAFRGASFEFYGRRYKDRLERAGLKVDLRETAGAVQNLELLQDPKSGVAIAFVTGGISNATRAPDLLSLGTVYYQPYWIFYPASESFENLSQLKGKRIAVGPEGSGTRFAAQTVLSKAGVTASTATFLPFAGNEAAKALEDDKVDVVWIIGAPGATAVQNLLKNPRAKLMSFPMADAFTRLLPELARLTLPQGVVDLEGPVPSQDVTLLATTTKILVRHDVHPETVHLLLKTMIEEHGGPDIFQKNGEFPIASDPEFPMAASAIDYYKNGPSLLHRHLPLWLTVYAQRLIALLIASIAIGVPVFSYLPRVYRWALKHRTRILYGRLGLIERALQTELSLNHVIELQKELESIDKHASGLSLPRRHLDLLFGLKVHINLVRGRLATRLGDAKTRGAQAA